MTDNFIITGNLESEKIEQLISNIKEEGNSSNLIITDVNSIIKKTLKEKAIMCRQ